MWGKAGIKVDGEKQVWENREEEGKNGQSSVSLLWSLLCLVKPGEILWVLKSSTFGFSEYIARLNDSLHSVRVLFLSLLYQYVPVYDKQA